MRDRTAAATVDRMPSDDPKATRAPAARRRASDPLLTSVAFAPGGGVWLQLDDRSGQARTGTYALFGAPQHAHVRVPGTVVACPPGGYWIVDADGWVHPRGGAPAICAHISFQTGYDTGLIVGAAATPSGDGLWALGADGAVWAVGDAWTLGHVRTERALATGIAATPSGRGYVIALSDGDVCAFGDAPSCEPPPWSQRRFRTFCGIALSQDRSGCANGYWLAAADGSVFALGDARFAGSGPGERRLPRVTGIAADASGRNLAWVNASGWVRTAQPGASRPVGGAALR